MRPPQKYYSVFSFFDGNSFAIMLGYWFKYNNSGLCPIVLWVSVFFSSVVRLIAD